jgi:OmpA-OmpF porin, OOP family
MQKKLITVAAIAAALMSGCASQPTPVFEPFQAQDLNPLLAAGYTQKVDNFFIINDSSSSMSDDYLGAGYAAQPAPTKFSVEKEILSRINQTIPNLPNPLTESIRSFGFGPCLDNHFTKLNQEPTAYSKATFSAGIESLECSSGGSPLDDGIVGSTEDLAASAGKIAVLIMSDGHDLDSYGTKEMAAMKSQYGDRLCVYGVWTGNSDEISGLAVLNQLSSIAGCGFAVSADSISTSEGMGKFVKSIFLQAGKPPVDPCSLDDDHDGVGNCQDKCPNTLSGVHVNQYGCWVVDIKFDNNKSDLKHSDVYRNPTVKHELDEVAHAILNHPEVRIEVQGHTSHTGTEKRNIVLGNERALNVKKYLDHKHPEIADRLSSKGYSWDRPIEGTDPADAVNRRVQFEVIK